MPCLLQLDVQQPPGSAVCTSPRGPGWFRWGELPSSITQQWEQWTICLNSCRWSLHQGEAHSFLPKCLTVLVNQAVESADKISGSSPPQSSPLSRIPEPPPSILEAHAVLHTETYICEMTEAIKSADNFQQICICCCCCCLYKWFLVNYKYKNQGPKIGFQRNHLQVWLNDTSLQHSKNHLSRKSRRNRGFSRGSHAKHLLEYIHILSQHLCYPATVTNWSTWALCQVVLTSGAVEIFLHTSSSQASWCSWDEEAASLRIRNMSCWKIPQCITHHTPLALELCTPPPHLHLHRFPESLLLQAGKANCLTWGCDSLVQRGPVGLCSMAKKSGKI